MKLSDWINDIPELTRRKPRLDEINYHWIQRIINKTGKNPNPADILEWIKEDQVDARRF